MERGSAGQEGDNREAKKSHPHGGRVSPPGESGAKLAPGPPSAAPRATRAVRRNARPCFCPWRGGEFGTRLRPRERPCGSRLPQGRGLWRSRQGTWRRGAALVLALASSGPRRVRGLRGRSARQCPRGRRPSWRRDRCAFLRAGRLPRVSRFRRCRRTCRRARPSTGRAVAVELGAQARQLLRDARLAVARRTALHCGLRPAGRARFPDARGPAFRRVRRRRSFGRESASLTPRRKAKNTRGPLRFQCRPRRILGALLISQPGRRSKKGTRSRPKA